MTPQEKDLILSVFDRLARAGAGPRDAEAEALINQRVVQQPDAVYGLVQAVLIQEMSLNQAQQHIAALEGQLAQASSAAPQPQGGGSFLGGAAGGFAGSVPNSSARWGAQQAAPQPQPQPQYQPQPQPQYAPQPQQPGFFQQPSGGGGFLRSAATMAAGVAGGTLLAEGIGSLFGGHRGGFGGGFGGSPWGGGQPTEIVENVTNNYYGGEAAQSGGQDAGWSSDAADAGYQDASYDDMSGMDGGYDDSQDI